MSAIPVVPFRPSRSARFTFTSANLSGGYFPGWGLPCSVLVHQIPIILAIFLSTLPTPPPPSPPPPVLPAKSRPHIQWMYFPKLPAVSQTSGEVKPQAQGVKPSPAPGSAPKGLVYPGPQEIVSDPPVPTNNIQTLIQPALKNAPILAPPLALPNLVMLADAGLARPPRPLPPPVKTPAEEQPKPPPVSLATVVATAPLPLKPAESPDFVASPPRPNPVPREEVKTEPEITAAELPKTETAEESQPTETAVMPAGGSDLDTVVALTPIPTDSEQAPKIPAGEARGRFAISPRPNLAGSEAAAPSMPGSPSKPVVIGIETGSASAPTTAMDPAAGDPPASVTVSFGPGPAAQKTPGAGMAVTASGSGSGSFAGITVRGGVGDTSGATNAALRPPLQTSYGVSVISTESSGGGLPSFGLFSSHDIYTVYVDMRETEDDSDPAWTLEVAVAQEPGVPGSAAKNIAAARGLVLPFPAAKKRPAFPTEIVRHHLRQMIIVYGVITAEGKMEQMSVKQSPEPALNASMLAALSQWVFRPASRNGTPFAVQILLGIPLWAHDLTAPPREVSISTVPPS
jgi:hypothetical protein